MKKEKFTTINLVNWEEHLRKGIWLVDFWAEWCSACVAQDRLYHELQSRYGERLNVGKINVNDNRVLSDQFGVRNIPFLLLMKDGSIISRFDGTINTMQLSNQIEKLLS